MTRKIKVVTTLGVSGIIETNATTLAELKPVLDQKEINYVGMKLLVGETKNELSEDAAILPEGDFKLYMVPVKTKSGVDFDDMEDTINEIFEIVSDIKKEVRSLSSSRSTGEKADRATSFEDDEDIAAVRKLSKDW